MQKNQKLDRSLLGRLARRIPRLDWPSLSHLERVALLGSLLIWLGVLVFGAGLLVVSRNRALDRESYASATAIAAAASTADAAPTSAPVLYPAGWATATPTVPATATAAPIGLETPLPRASDRPGAETTELTPPAMAEAATTGGGVTLKAPNARQDVDRTASPVEREVEPSPPAPTGPPDRILIPSIELDQPVVAIGLYTIEENGRRYAVWDVADYAASWHKTSAYPGQNGNVVLNGHNNIKGEVFRDLIDVEVGDRVLLYVGDRAFSYEVEQKMILKEKGEPPEVQRQNALWIGPSDQERLTMVTCWPYTSNTHRLIVVARPVEPLPNEGLQQ